jgi:hypothetical protein
VTNPRIVAAALFSLFTLGAHADTRIVGTDLFGLEFSKALYEFAGRNSLRLALAFDGSRPGLAELRAGRADAAILVLPPGDLAPPAAPAFTSFTIAYHRVLVLVPADCPLERMTLDQVAAVFGAGPEKPVARWGDLGAGGDWTGKRIAAIAPETGTGIALELFRHTVLKDREFKPALVRYTTPAELAAQFGGETRVIALAAAIPPGLAKGKVVALSVRPGGPAFAPTAENVHSSDYPLRLPIRVVFRSDAAGRLRLLLQFLAGDAAATYFERAGVVPLPVAARTQQAVALNAL